jgi:hypothetical protein
VAVLASHAHAAPAPHPALGGGAHGAAAAAAVIGAAPKRYSAQEAEQREALSRLRREEAAAEQEAAAGGGGGGGGQAEKHRAHDFKSKAVPVADVFANPSLNLPREKQERKARAARLTAGLLLTADSDVCAALHAGPGARQA